MTAIAGFFAVIAVLALLAGPVVAAFHGEEAAQTFWGVGIIAFVLCSIFATLSELIRW
ncbi:MAG: hypothetical protein Q4G70_01395 [Pseudomonadota bacterium]|nr:hypothetical protein [Pseudomonadota bacterium]